MRLLMPFLITALFCSPGMFVGHRGGVPQQETAAVLNGGIGHASADDSHGTGPDRGLFDRFVGTWDVNYETYDKEGHARPNRGAVTYTWILDGAALQETWTSDAHEKEPKPFGTSIIFYDSKRKSWTEVWIYPAQGMTTIMNGNAEDGRIVLNGRDEAGARLRWSFNDIQADAFVWRGEISTDDGKTWRTQGENHIRRHPS